MSRLVPFRPQLRSLPPETPPRTAPAPDRIAHRSPRALRAEWLSDDAPRPATGIEALLDWVEGRA